MNAATTPAIEAAVTAGLEHKVCRFGRVGSAEEAAAAQGIGLGNLLKSLIVRKAEDDYLFVLVPADRAMDWTKLRKAVGERRLSLPDGDEAFAVTGYRPGTITPFGATTAWPVIADERIAGRGIVAIGGGSHGVSLHIEGSKLIEHLGADVVDVTKGPS